MAFFIPVVLLNVMKVISLHHPLRFIFMDFTTPVRFLPWILTLPVKDPFLSMQCPSGAYIGWGKEGEGRGGRGQGGSGWARDGGGGGDKDEGSRTKGRR